MLPPVALLWGQQPELIKMDRRATEETEWVKKTIGEDEIFRITGNIIDPFYGYTKMLWIKRQETLMTAYEWCVFVNFPHVAYDSTKLYSFAGITAGAVVRWFRSWKNVTRGMG